MKMKDIPQFLRPREKMALHGAHALSDTELLALVIRAGIRSKSALALAEDVMVGGTIHQFVDNPTLQTKVGIGPVTSASLEAVVELCKRYKLHTPRSRIVSKDDALLHLHEYRNLKKEHFIALYLNARYELIYKEVISIGTLDASLVHPREVFGPALTHHAAYVLVAHNHPSDATEPSQADIALTHRLVEVGELLHVPVIDHIILTSVSALSMRETGTM